MKKKLIFSFLFIMLFFLTACSSNNTGDKVLMDQLASDNKYHYTNESLGFSVNFPEQFIYYQSQKIKKKDYTDIEFFAPTSDREYPQEIQSYAKYLSVRVFDKDAYSELNDGEKNNFIKLDEKNNKIYLAIFWDKIPSDWHDKWDNDVKNEIISSFRINQ